MPVLVNMNKKNRMSIHGRRGFTLIELLVVIAIIGILSSIVLASLNSARKKGRDARRISDLKQLQLALELAYDSASSYPPAAAGAVPDTLVSSSYIAAIPKDPSTDDDYSYAALQSDGTTACTAAPCSSYVIKATLETGGHTAFSGDIDTNPIGGLNCDDTSPNLGYCVKP